MTVVPGNFTEFERIVRQAEREFPGDQRRLLKVVLTAMQRGDLNMSAVRRIYAEDTRFPLPNPTGPGGIDLMELGLRLGLGGQSAAPVAPPPSADTHQAQRYAVLYRQTRHAIEQAGIRVNELNLEGAANGYATPWNTIEIEERLPDDYKFEVIIHELAHTAARHLYGKNNAEAQGLTRDHVEYEADRVVWNICSRYDYPRGRLLARVAPRDHLRGNPRLERHITEITDYCCRILGI